MQFFAEQMKSLHCYKHSLKSEELEINSLKDGDKISPFETVLTIHGPYENFGFLEGVIDGILARRTSVATNVYNVVQAT